MSGYDALGYRDVAVAASLVLVNGLLSAVLRLGLERRLAWAALRMTVQLLLIGFVLKWVFTSESPALALLVVVPMTLIAGVSSANRTPRVFPGMMLASIVSTWVSAWLVATFALTVVLHTDRWWTPAHTIPLIGLILGNTLNGIALALDRFVAELTTKRAEIETQLCLGATRWEAASDAVRQALRAGLTPMMNSMFVAGVVSLPGIMTGQIIAGADPTQAARYQIVVMFLLAASSALGTMGVVLLSYARLFNARHQFRNDLITRRGGG